MCDPSPIPVVTSNGGWGRITTIPLEAAANPAGRSSVRALLLPPTCQHPPSSRPPCSPSVSEPGAPAQPSAEILHEHPSPADLTVALPGIIQEGRLTPGEKQTLSNTCAAPAWGACGPRTSGSCLFDLLLPMHAPPYTALSKKDVGTARGLGKPQNPEHLLLTP